MSFAAELLIAALVVVGAIFGLVGSIGLAKLPDLMTRLHGPTKVTTLGVGSTLIASMLYFALALDDLSYHELAITIFLFLTAPITAHFLAKAYLHRHRAEIDLPDPPPGCAGWATLEPPPEPRAVPDSDRGAR